MRCIIILQFIVIVFCINVYPQTNYNIFSTTDSTKFYKKILEDALRSNWEYSNYYLTEIIKFIDKIEETNNDSLLIKGLSAIGILYDRLGNFDYAIEYNKKALHKAEELYGLHSLEYLGYSSYLQTSLFNNNTYIK